MTSMGACWLHPLLCPRGDADTASSNDCSVSKLSLSLATRLRVNSHYHHLVTATDHALTVIVSERYSKDDNRNLVERHPTTSNITVYQWKA